MIDGAAGYPDEGVLTQSIFESITRLSAGTGGAR